MTLFRRKWTEPDMINNPPHYQRHASGVEIIEVTEQLDHLSASALAYVERAPYKGSQLADLRKAQWFLNRLHNGEPMDPDAMTRFRSFEVDGSLASLIIDKDPEALPALDQLIMLVERSGGRRRPT